jgi:hypothetical protein
MAAAATWRAALRHATTPEGNGDIIALDPKANGTSVQARTGSPHGLAFGPGVEKE